MFPHTHRCSGQSIMGTSPRGRHTAESRREVAQTRSSGRPLPEGCARHRPGRSHTRRRASPTREPARASEPVAIGASLLGPDREPPPDSPPAPRHLPCGLPTPQPRFRWGEPGGERRQCRGGPRLLRTVLRALRLLTRSADVAFFGGWRDAFPAPFLGRRGGAALPDGACPAGCTLLGDRLPEPQALHQVDSAMDSKSAERMTLSSDTRYLAGSGFSMVNGTWQLHTTSPKKRPVRCSLATHLPRHPQRGVPGGQKPRPFPLSGRPPPQASACSRSSGRQDGVRRRRRRRCSKEPLPQAAGAGGSCWASRPRGASLQPGL